MPQNLSWSLRDANYTKILSEREDFTKTLQTEKGSQGYSSNYDKSTNLR
jgi:hypothetical protein